MSKKVVLITGCSSGLGFALGKYLSGLSKYKIVLTARQSSFGVLKKQFRENEDLMLLTLDITNSQEVRKVVDYVIKRWNRIDVLVNNAGICFRGVVEHMDEDSELVQLQTNYLGPMNLIRAVLPVMREQMSGHILNVSSVSGMVSMPTMASYSASKHALEGATESLWYEAKPYGIKVTLIQPGFIRSDSFQHVMMSKKADLSQKLKGPHSEYYRSMTPLIERLMRMSRTSPLDIAEAVERCIRKSHPPLRMRVTLDAKVFHLLRRILPAQFFHQIMFFFLPGSLRWGCLINQKFKKRTFKVLQNQQI